MFTRVTSRPRSPSDCDEFIFQEERCFPNSNWKINTNVVKKIDVEMSDNISQDPFNLKNAPKELLITLDEVECKMKCHCLDECRCLRRCNAMSPPPPPADYHDDYWNPTPQTDYQPQFIQSNINLMDIVAEQMNRHGWAFKIKDLRQQTDANAILRAIIEYDFVTSCLANNFE